MLIKCWLSEHICIFFFRPGGPLYDLTAPTELKPRHNTIASNLSSQKTSDYEPIQCVTGAKGPEKFGARGRVLRRCPSEPALTSTSTIYDNSGYISMSSGQDSTSKPGKTSSPSTAEAAGAEDEYMYMKSGVSALPPAVSATSVASATMKKSPTAKKGPKAAAPPKLPGGIGTRKVSPANSRPRASTMQTTTRGLIKIEKSSSSTMTTRVPPVLPKPKAGATPTSATLTRDKPGVGESVQERIDKLRDRCNSDKPEKHTVNRRKRVATLTVDRRSSSCDRLLTVGIEGETKGSVQAALKALGASDQRLAQGRPRLRKTHSRSHSASGSNASLGTSPLPPAGARGRKSPKDLSVSPTSSGYSSSGD